MRTILSVLILIALTAPASAGKYRGRAVDLDFQAAPVSDVIRLLSDVGRFNVVLVDVPEIKLDVRAKKLPWDQVLDDVLARAKLAAHRTGNLYVIGAPAWIAERKKAKARTYKGATVWLDVRDADAVAVAQLLRVVAGAKVDVKPGAPRKVSLRLSRVPADQAFELVALQAGTTEVATPTVPPEPTVGCVAATAPVAKLKLVAIARANTRRAALFVDDAGAAHVLGAGGCLGKEATKATLADDAVELDAAGGKQVLQLPSPAKP